MIPVDIISAIIGALFGWWGTCFYYELVKGKHPGM